MPTPHGNELNAICLRCQNIDIDQPERPAGWCSFYNTEKAQLLVLHRCVRYIDMGQEYYEANLAKIREAGGIGA